MNNITHRPKGRMCIECKSFRWQITDERPCPKTEDFKDMRQIGKDSDGVIVVKCSNFERNTDDERRRN